MKNLLFAKYQLVFLACLLLGSIPLEAQNTGVVLNNFKAFSFINNDQIVDSLDYNPEVPTGGPVQFLEDSLVIVTPDGAFQLNYTPNDTKAFVAIWVDVNNNGLFEAEEAIYEGEANEGNLADTLNLPIFSGSRPALVAISNDQKNLVDPREIPVNPEISSLRFIMRSNPPKLTMTSKKGDNTIQESIPEFCDTLISFYIKNDSTSNCLTVNSWTITYPVNNTLTVNPSSITQSPSGAIFGVGQMINPGDSLNLALDISGLPIMDNDTVNFTFHFFNCYDSIQVDSISFQFVNCKSSNARDLRNEFARTTNLSINPNPIRSNSIIEFDLLKPGPVQLSLRDISGRLVETFHEQSGIAGHHSVSYTPPKLVGGLYILSLQTKYGTVSKKIVIASY